VLFTANAHRLSLPAMDDCYYARKAVEMRRSGSVYTVSWNSRPNFQNPPLQLWLVSRSQSLFGENDFAGRLPSILMGLGILGIVWRIGARLWNRSAGLLAASLLLLTPLFVNHARRLMMDLPLTFWVVFTIALLLEFPAGSKRHMLVAFPLAAALLTKSILGLLPVLIFLGALIVDRPLRRSLLTPWLWIGVLLGLALFATWPLYTWRVFGENAVKAHFLEEIASRATETRSLKRLIVDYPAAILGSFQPLLFPALIGAWSLCRRSGDAPGRIITIWMLLPIALYSLSSAQSPRYLIPTLPAMALAAGYWIDACFPRLTALLPRLTAVMALVTAAVFWLRPSWLNVGAKKSFKHEGAALVAQAVPADETIPYLGDLHWGIANRMLYYAERSLERTQPSPYAAVAAARARRARLLVIDNGRRAEIQALAPIDDVFTDRGWAIVRIR
jgi:4-amino-4-deoxy-L-arabinose transferase